MDLGNDLIFSRIAALNVPALVIVLLDPEWLSRSITFVLQDVGRLPVRN